MDLAFMVHAGAYKFTRAGPAEIFLPQPINTFKPIAYNKLATSLIESLAFAPMQRQGEDWKGFHLSDAAAKLTIYHAFIEDALEAPKHLARRVNDLYFNPTHDAFKSPDVLESLERLHVDVQGT